MNARIKLNIYVMAVAVFVWLTAISNIANAASPANYPTSINAYDFEWSGSRVSVAWEQSNGEWFCGTGTIDDFNNIFISITERQPGESLPAWVERHNHRFFTRDLNTNDIAACQVLWDRNQAVWIVDQWRTNATRPVYAINNLFPSTKTKIGTIPHSTQCGTKVASYSATITKYEWRRVTVGSIEGVSVCRKQ